MKIECPIWPESKIELVDKIKFDDLVWLYRKNYGLDISDELPGEGVALYRNIETDFHFFYPMISGSEYFYKNLYSKLLYNESKNEYKWASSFIEHNQEVLDVGCGFGCFSDYIPQAKFFGIDLNPNAVERGKSKGLNIECELIESVVNRKKLYDVVTTFQVLEHVENPLNFFSSCVQVLRAGGIFIVSVPNSNGYLGVMENAPLNLPPHHMTRWSIRSLIRLGNDFGLALIDYDEEKLASLACFAQILYKERMDRYLGRPKRLVRTSLLDRMLNWIFLQSGRLLPYPRKEIAPNGTSITLAFRKL